MSKLNSSDIVEVVLALTGDIEAYGSEHIDSDRFNNQKKLEEVVDTLLYEIYKNTKYAKRVEHSMKKIGEDAEEFLGYLVNEYNLNDFVRKEE